jgi:hypothetical protein
MDAAMDTEWDAQEMQAFCATADLAVKDLAGVFGFLANWVLPKIVEQ